MMKTVPIVGSFFVYEISLMRSIMTIMTDFSTNRDGHDGFHHYRQCVRRAHI